MGPERPDRRVPLVSQGSDQLDEDCVVFRSSGLGVGPVGTPVDPDFAVEGLRLERGTLPARTEAYVRLIFDSANFPQDVSDAVPHPAFLDLMERIEESGVEPAVSRQVGLLGEDELPAESTSQSLFLRPEPMPACP